MRAACPKDVLEFKNFLSPKLALPALKMLSGAKTFEVSVHHNRQSCTKSLALFHAERESHVNILTAKIIGYKFESVHNKKKITKQNKNSPKPQPHWYVIIPFLACKQALLAMPGENR